MNITLADVWPTRLQSAREKVVQQHPQTAVGVALPSGGLEVLRRRVEACRNDAASLDSLGAALTSREVRALVTGLEQWDGLRQPVSVLLKARARATLVLPLWRAWQKFPHVSAIRELLLMFSEQFGWASAVDPSVSPLVVNWIEADAPGVRIQAWLDADGASYSDLPARADSILLPETPLTKLIRDAVMTHGSQVQLRREGESRLVAWFKELSPPSRVLFGQNYLSQMPLGDWQWNVLRLVEQTFGLPRRPRMEGFWDPLSEEVRREFQRLFIQKKLKEELGHATDRHKYWGRWEKELADIQRGHAGSTRYAILDFGGFGVIEFFEEGNAAYFYDEENLQKMARLKPRHPRELKEWEGPKSRIQHRLIHRGTWSVDADWMVRQWMRKYR
jgi:hypothetical protein